MQMLELELLNAAGASTAAGAAGAATGAPPKLSMSSRVTRPPLPVGTTAVISPFHVHIDELKALLILIYQGCLLLELLLELQGAAGAAAGAGAGAAGPLLQVRENRLLLRFQRLHHQRELLFLQN